jgi:hypothetical protein
VSHNTWDYKNALERPLNDNIESWEVSHFEAKYHGLFCAKLFKKPNDPKEAVNLSRFGLLTSSAV